MSEHERDDTNGGDGMEQAVESLRAFARHVPPDAAGTRRRILAGAQNRPRRSIRGLLYAVALLAVAGPALAHFTGQLPALTQALAGWFGASSEAHDVGARARSSVPELARAAQPTAGVPTSVPELDSKARNEYGNEQSAAPAQRSAPQPANDGQKHVAQTTERAHGTERAQSTAGDDEHPEPSNAARALYLTAHRAHFGGGSPDAALRAWDAFLSAAPNDAFAPEARYNRAILLVKLDRLQQALEALAPFACAAPGSYRQREASALIARARVKQPQLPALACEREKP